MKHRRYFVAGGLLASLLIATAAYAGRQTLGGIGFLDGVMFAPEEASPPSVPANTGLIYARDDGGGNTEVVVDLPTNGVRVLANDTTGVPSQGLSRFWLVQLTADQAIGDATGTTVTWDNEVSDDSAIHSGGTVTLDVTGRYYVGFGGGWDATGATGRRSWELLVNGAVVASEITDDSSGAALAESATVGRTLDLTSGDTITCRVHQVTGGTLDFTGGVAESYFTGILLENEGQAFIGVSVDGTGNQSLTNDTLTTINWDAENFDATGWHDTVTNNDRLTVPASADGRYVVVNACVRFAASTAGMRFVNIVQRDSGDTTTIDRCQAGVTAVNGGAGLDDEDRVNVVFGPVLVSSGQFFRVQAYQNSGGALNARLDLSLVHAYVVEGN